MNDSRYTVVGPLGALVTTSMMHIFRPATCAHCQRPITSYGLSLGEPFHCMLHRQCAPHFDFTNGWPHPGAVVSYVAEERYSSTASGNSNNSGRDVDVYSSSPQRARAGSFGSQGADR